MLSAFGYHSMGLPLSVSLTGVFSQYILLLEHIILYAAMCNTSCAFVASPEIIRIKNLSHSVCSEFHAKDAQRSSQGFRYE